MKFKITRRTASFVLCELHVLRRLSLEECVSKSPAWYFRRSYQLNVCWVFFLCVDVDVYYKCTPIMWGTEI